MRTYDTSNNTSHTPHPTPLCVASQYSQLGPSKNSTWPRFLCWFFCSLFCWLCTTFPSCLMSLASASLSCFPLSSSSQRRLAMSCLISFNSPGAVGGDGKWRGWGLIIQWSRCVTAPGPPLNSPSFTWSFSLSRCAFKMYLLMRRFIVFCNKEQRIWASKQCTYTCRCSLRL